MFKLEVLLKDEQEDKYDAAELELEIRRVLAKELYLTIREFKLTEVEV